MANEGESYLDELLNTVAPDWEDTPISAENILEDFDEDLEEEVSLEDALAILDDLPDSEIVYEDDESWDGVDELAGLTDFGEDIGEVTDFGETPAADSELASDPAPEKSSAELSKESSAEPPKESSAEPPEESSAEPPKKSSAAEEAVPDETAAEEMPDIPLDTMLEEDLSGGLDTADEPMSDIPEMDIPVFDDAPASSDQKSGPEDQPSGDSVDVDDIFQDALSAVGYSGNDEEDEDDFLTVDPVGGFMEDGDEGITSVPPADPLREADARPKKKEKKGPGFFARIFGNVITDQTAAQEEKERQEEQAAKEKKAAAKEEKKKQAEISKEEKAQQAQEAKERKKQLKAEQAAKKAEEKEEKKRLKAERKAEEAAQEVVGKINPVGAAIVVIFFATIGILTFFGSMLLNRNTSLKNAENYFASGEYMQAYDAIHMIDVDEENDSLYRRIRICAEMQKEIDSYVNYSSMNMQVEALDSLIKGVRFYDLNKSEADSLGIAGQVDRLGGRLSENLSRFGMDADAARNLLQISDQREYTRQLEEIVNRIPAV